MFDVVNRCFNNQSYCLLKVHEDCFTEENVACFDNDGFELTLLEQAFYETNRFPLEVHLNHRCFQYPWLTTSKQSEFILDHALLLERKGFNGEAREQILQHKENFPQLKKYLKVAPKWGVDFALEYHTDYEYIEVLHFEYDYDSLVEAEEKKKYFEQKILNTDWNDFVCSLKRRTEEWVYLKGFSQNDWKASFWGLPKAEVIIKSFF